MLNLNRCFATDDIGNIIKGDVVYKNNHIELKISAKDIDVKAHSLTAFQEVFSANVGDNGFYLGSNDFGRFSGFKTYFLERDDFDSVVGINLINMFGVKIGGAGYTAIVTKMAYVYRLRISKYGDKYCMGLFYDLDKISISEDICLELYPMKNAEDYIQMAKLYRRYQLNNGTCSLLKTRISGNKILDYVS